MPGGPETEQNETRNVRNQKLEQKGKESAGKRTTTTKQNTINNSYLIVEEVTQQILSLGTKPFVLFTDALFEVDVYF